MKPSGPVRLVFAGRIEPEKGLHEFLSILPADFDGTMTIIGDGSELDRCRRTIRQRQLDSKVAFIGRLSHEESLTVIASCHVLVLPSLWWENCPMSLLEALGSGTNILVSQSGGMAEIVQASDVGFTFAPRDAASLRHALKGIAEQHLDGSLNAFDLGTFLEQRSEETYVANLLSIYQGKSHAHQPRHVRQLSTVDA
jgi:glycosyltransferase involved in cell wall biosynthesis